jgi:hypothetical protein
MEKLCAAYVKVTFGIDDAAIGALYRVTNVGRVNEGIKEVLAPLGLGYKDREDEPYQDPSVALLRKP